MGYANSAQYDPIRAVPSGTRLSVSQDRPAVAYWSFCTSRPIGATHHVSSGHLTSHRAGHCYSIVFPAKKYANDASAKRLRLP